MGQSRMRICLVLGVSGCDDVTVPVLFFYLFYFFAILVCYNTALEFGTFGLI